MRIVLFLMIVGFVHVSAESFSQTRKLSLDLKNETLENVLYSIERKSEFRFAYGNDYVNLDRKLTIKVKDENIENVLEEIFADEDVWYEIQENYILIYPKKEVYRIQQENGMVQGVVTDQYGEALPGVNVFIKGTSVGVITGTDGTYSISNVPADATLVYSFIGMEVQEIVVSGRAEIDVVLMAEVIGLEEVVAVGYATQKKVNLTGSVSAIDTEDLQSSAVTNTSTALQGKASGVTVRQNSGLAGEDNASIKIRGIGTLNAGQEPLVLVDGVQMSMNSIDPMDIESIAILKDAASAAIYGSRAANGVIIITTKGGKKSQPVTISYNSYYGIQQITNLPDMLNSYEHAMLYNEALENDGLPHYFSEEELTHLQNAIRVDHVDFPNNLSGDELEKFETNGYYQDVDYAKMTYRNAALQKHYLSIDGGGENSYGRLGIGYTNQEGTRVGNEAETYNIKMNYNVSLLDEKIKIYSNIYYLRNEYDKGAPSTRGNWYVTPWLGYYYPNGYYGGEADIGDLKAGAYDVTTKNQVVGLLGTKINPVKNLDVTLEYSQVRNFDKRDEFAPYRVTYNFFNDVYGNNRSGISLESIESFKQTGTATTSYQFNINDQSKFKLLAGTSFEEYTYKMFGTSRMDLINNFQPELNLGSTATMMNWSSATDYAMASFFGRVNYSFRDRYLLEMNLRMDGSSRFSAGNQWGTFPSASFGWRISEEGFMKELKEVDNLKLRLSYGQLGNQSIDNYAARDMLIASENGSYPINDELETTVGIGSLANKEITWETTAMGNVGVDMTMFQQLNLSFDYYKKVSNDVLYRIAIPATVGVQEGPYRNIAEVQNIGWDLSIGWDKRFSRGFQLGAQVNVSRYENEISKLSDTETTVFLQDSFDDNTSSYLYVWQEGKPINSYFGYTVGGIATQEQIDNGLIPDQESEITAGDLWYKDVAGDDNKITDDDRGIIGDPHPDFIYSFNLTAKWKGFDVSLLLEGVQGLDELLYSAMYRPEFSSHVVNKPGYMLDRWTVDNQDASIPKVRALRDKIRMSDYYIEDASYLRGKDLTVGYTLPKNTLQKIGLKNVRLYANFRNLFLLTNFRGVDPETNDYNDTSKAGRVPPSKVYTLGLQLQL
jgi:TonB-linked SusC/RagA family outer membrane protein